MNEEKQAVKFVKSTVYTQKRCGRVKARTVARAVPKVEEVPDEEEVAQEVIDTFDLEEVASEEIDLDPTSLVYPSDSLGCQIGVDVSLPPCEYSGPQSRYEYSIWRSQIRSQQDSWQEESNSEQCQREHRERDSRKKRRKRNDAQQPR